MDLSFSTIKSRVIEIWNHVGFQKYFRNTGWLFGEKVLRIFVGLFVSVWVARYLGPERYGLFNYAVSFASLFTVLSSLGLDNILVRELVKDNKKRDLLLGTVFILKIIGAFISLFILFIATFLTGNTNYENILIFIVALAVIFQSFNVIDFYFQSKVLSKYVVIANVVSLLTSSFLKIFLILTNASLIYFVWVVLFDSFILALGYIYFYKRQGLQFFKWNFDGSIAKSLLKDSWPLILSSITIMIYMRIDQIMIKNMIGNNAVGQYAVAVKLSEIWYFIPVVISSSLFPAIINAKRQSEELYYRRLQKLYKLVVWTAALIAIPTTFLSNWLVVLLYGNQYAQSGNVLAIYIWAGVFVALGVASSKWFISENLQILSFWRTFCSMIINIILNLYLIPKYGLQGAAVATLVSQIIAVYIYDFFNLKTRTMFWIKTKAFFPIILK